MAKRANSSMEYSFADGVHVWTFPDGKKVSFDCAVAEKTDVGGHAMVHGLKQKIGDAAAISRDPTTGKPATATTKREAMQRVVDSLNAGQWNAPREGGNEGGILLEALFRMYHGKKSRESLQTWLKSQSDKQKAALRSQSKKLKPHIDAIRAERGKALGLDGDAILASIPE